LNPLALNILIELRNRQQYGDTEPRLLSMLRVGGERNLTAPELEKALRDLADKSWVTPFNAVLVGKKWRITALGESALTEAGL
jgi:hypothetical protein